MSQLSPNGADAVLTIAQTGPPLPETLQLLAPLASTLEALNLCGNKLGGTITADIEAFTKLTALGLFNMDLRGAWVMMGVPVLCAEAF